MANAQKINNILDGVIDGLLQLKEAINDLPMEKVAEVAPTPVVPTVINDDDLGDFESLKKALNSERWPAAVNPRWICDPENKEEVSKRGAGIIDLMIPDQLKDLRLLDIGCGAGYTPLAAAKAINNEVQMAVGYDIKEFPEWSENERPNLIYTTDFETVVQNGPYDIIIIYDVIDHLKGEEPISLLKKAEKVLSPSGKIYLRCHPFVSRHGTHLYHDLNKAFVHLVFSPDELKKLVPTSKYEEKSLGVIYPIKSYQTMIDASGLRVENKKESTEKVEPFFKIPKIAQRIMKNTKTTSFPDFQMSLSFVDWVLKKS